jgi:hypothetical protein
MAKVQGRRAFLRLTAAAGGAGLLSSCSRNAGPAATGTPRPADVTSSAPANGAAPATAPRATGSPTPADWTALGHDLSGPLVRPGEAA